MKTIIKTVSETYTDRGSKFLGYLCPVTGQKDIDRYLAGLIEKYPDATHHCYAFRVDPETIQELAQDDGEPGGTAGMPMLNALKSAGLINVLMVAVRFFGGSKLGKAGLINAYRTITVRCIEKAQTGELFPVRRFRLVYPYPEQKQIDQLVHAFNLKVKNEMYTEIVKITLECEDSLAAELKKKLESQAHSGIELEYLGKFYGVR